MQVLRGAHHIQNRPGVNPDDGSILHTTFGYACFGRILEPMLVEVVEVAVRPASVYQRGNGIDAAFEVFRFEFKS